MSSSIDSTISSPKITRLRFFCIPKSNAVSTAAVNEKSILNCRENPSLKFNAMGAARPPHNVTRYTQFPVKWRHDNMQNTWVTPRGPEKLRWLVSRWRDGIYFIDFTQVARFGRLWDSPPPPRGAGCTMHNANIVYVLLVERERQREREGEGQARERTAIATADNGGSGQKNNRCFRAYGIVRRILRTILALWCKCRSESTPREKALRIYEPWIERPRYDRGFPGDDREIEIEGGGGERMTKHAHGIFIVIPCSMYCLVFGRSAFSARAGR